MREIVTKLLDWFLPERGVKKYMLDELRKEITRLNNVIKEHYAEREKLEERIQKLEIRFEKESCLRFACRHRLSIDRLPTTETCIAGANDSLAADKD